MTKCKLCYHYNMWTTTEDCKRTQNGEGCPECDWGKKKFPKMDKKRMLQILNAICSNLTWAPANDECFGKDKEFSRYGDELEKAIDDLGD